MSDHIVTLIPCLHTYRTNVQRAEAAVEALRHLVEAEEITFRQSERPEFVDCGAALSEVRCPRCGALLPMDWWREKMEEMYQADHFFILEQELPCCGKTVSFNQLRYSRPCGFFLPGVSSSQSESAGGAGGCRSAQRALRAAVSQN